MSEATLTAEEITAIYKTSLDSVALITELMALDSRNDFEKEIIERNVEHLELMVDQDYWTDQDLDPLKAAITAGASA